MVDGRGRTRVGRRGVALVVVALLAIAGVGTWLLVRPSGAAAAQTLTTTVASGTFQKTVSATGTLAARKQADLDFGVSGEVTHVLVGAGDTVTKGQVLARLDSTSLETSVVSARASLEAAEEQYDTDADSGTATDATLAADTAQTAAARSALSSAEDALDDATLRATMSGTVASVGVAVGDQVSGTSSSSSGSAGGTGGTGSSTPSSSASTAATTTNAVVIVSPREFTVTTDVPADDITSVKKGMQATITPTGSTTPVYGTVTAISLVAETSSTGAAQFPVTVTITGKQSGLYVGTSATVAIITKQVEQRADRARARPAHQRLHDVRRQARQRQEGQDHRHAGRHLRRLDR